MVKLLTDYTTQIYHALSTDARPTANPGDRLREIDTGKCYIFDGSAWNELPDGGGGGGTSIQAPYKVSSGSIIPASNTQALHVPLNGITIVAVATILVDDYENYATRYIDSAPIFIRMNQTRNTPISVGNPTSSGASLKEDGTVAGVSNSNGSGISGTDYVFGSYVSNTYFRSGVTYNYVVVGV